MQPVEPTIDLFPEADESRHHPNPVPQRPSYFSNIKIRFNIILTSTSGSSN
jgi:hypothetical protein